MARKTRYRQPDVSTRVIGNPATNTPFHLNCTASRNGR